jgi:hypothetical protein
VNGVAVKHPQAHLVCYRRKEPASSVWLDLDDEREPRLCVPSLVEPATTPDKKNGKGKSR